MKQLMLWLSMFTLAALSCGMPVNTQPTAEMSMNVSYPSITPAPVPIRASAESTSEAIACGMLWVRYGAGIEYGVASFALKGDTLFLTDAKQRAAEDGGQWQQVVDRDGKTGWVNARYLCEVK